VNELYHDLQAGEFDRVHAARHRAESEFWRARAAPRLRRAGARRGVDLCTGTGFVPGVLLEELPAEATVLCVDLSAGALDVARRRLERFAGRVSFHAGDVAAVPLPDGAADWVSLNAGLHHIPSPAGVLAEVDRLLRPGGLFLLGHEPNAAFFRCRFLTAMERLIWHGFWYLSPARNLRRLARCLGRRVEAYEDREHLDAINRQILAEGLAEAPLALDELRAIVDVHTHEDDAPGAAAGFAVDSVRREHFPRYRVEELRFADYGGEMLLRHGWLRAAYDGLMRRCLPGRGRLFSWILRKPAAPEGPAR